MSEHDLPAGCAAIDDDLSAWLDGELDAAGAARVRGHVEGCARCAARVAALRAVDDGLRALAASEASDAERERLARLRARLATAQQQLQPLPGRAIASDEATSPDVDAASPDARAAAPRRRRRWLPAAGAAIAAALLAALVLPGLLERAVMTPETELAAREDAPAVPAPAVRPEPAPPAPAAPAAREQFAQQAPPAFGRLGASAVDEGAPPPAPSDAADAAARQAALDRAFAPAAESPAADADALDLAIALAELGGVEPADLEVVEHLDALARMTLPGASDEAAR